jgi:hypothetical protein
VIYHIFTLAHPAARKEQQRFVKKQAQHYCDDFQSFLVAKLGFYNELGKAFQQEKEALAVDTSTGSAVTKRFQKIHCDHGLLTKAVSRLGCELEALASTQQLVSQLGRVQV